MDLELQVTFPGACRFSFLSSHVRSGLAGLVDYLNNPTTYDGHGLSASKRGGSGLESAFAASCSLLLNRSQGHLGGSPIHQGRRHLAQDALHEAAGLLIDVYRCHVSQKSSRAFSRWPQSFPL